LKTNEFDPLAYIENAFLDKSDNGKMTAGDDLGTVEIPTMAEFLSPNGKEASMEPEELAPGERPKRFRKTVMSAPRPRRAKGTAPSAMLDPDLQNIWQNLPRSVEFLCSFYDDSVTAHYYRGEFKETRQDLIRRLLDPELSLEETSRLLGVCPATVRRYTNRGWLAHHRTSGGQRRFRLSDVVKFVDAHGRFPES
jgi:excisionase family DNA binding protein